MSAQTVKVASEAGMVGLTLLMSWMQAASLVVTIIATTLAAVWTAIKIYESDTCQRLIRWLRR
jgi:hypothetical protein